MTVFLTAAASVLLSAFGVPSAPAHGPMQAQAPVQCPIATVFFLSENKCTCPKGTVGRKVSVGYAQCDYEVKAFLPTPGALQLKKGQKYPAADGTYLIFQNDGNIAVYSKDNQHRWDVARVIGNRYQQITNVFRQADGQLSAHSRDGKRVWISPDRALK